MHDNYKNMVVILCMTYNQKSFIRQCLDGFVMQKTDFPFTAIVADDASTDEEPRVLWDFIKNELDPATLQKGETNDFVRVIGTHSTNTNCNFVFFFLKYNHYHKKAKRPYFKEWYESTKYHAICEGDDYWTDPQKLQKQVNVLESNSEIMMVCNRVKLYSEIKKKFIGENYCYNKSQVVNPKDVIYRTGLFISTCSVMYRKTIMDNIPNYWAQCKVGDYPLQIMCAMKGKIYYFNDIMSVYRVENSSSWMGKQKWVKFDKTRLEVIKSQINMFKGFSKDFPQYKKYFDRKIANHINRFIPSKCSKEEKIQYLDFFHEEIENYTWTQKIDLWVRCQRKRKLKYYFVRIFQNQYNQRKITY